MVPKNLHFCQFSWQCRCCFFGHHTWTITTLWHPPQTTSPNSSPKGTSFLTSTPPAQTTMNSISVGWNLSKQPWLRYDFLQQKKPNKLRVVNTLPFYFHYPSSVPLLLYLPHSASGWAPLRVQYRFPNGLWIPQSSLSSSLFWTPSEVLTESRNSTPYAKLNNRSWDRSSPLGPVSVSVCMCVPCVMLSTHTFLK